LATERADVRWDDAGGDISEQDARRHTLRPTLVIYTPTMRASIALHASDAYGRSMYDELGALIRHRREALKLE